MSSTDDRIVKMQFDNASFKKGAEDTKKSLADLDKAGAAAGKTGSKGLMDMEGAMNRVSVTASKMSIVTTTALATIANKAVNVGLQMAKSLTVGPIQQGFAEYEQGLTKLNTIMNATGLTQRQVSKVLQDLNRYSDETIYSFSNMTESITKFVNAGVPLDKAAKSVKGIANAAAYAGASSEEANRAMYAFSQSMSMGFIMLQDWNQIENANMGTIQFKNTLLEAGVAAGTLTKRGKEYITASGKVVTASKGWRDGLQEQWATTEVLNSALAKYTDTSTKLGREATESATEVRTFTAFMDTLKESLGSGWAGIFKALIGNLNQATTFWTGLSNTIGGSVQTMFDWATTTLKVWRNMGGANKVLQGFKNLLSPIGALLTAVGDAWREAFPDSGRGAGKALYGLSAGFEAVTRPLQLLADLIRGTTPVLTTLFTVFRIGGELIGRAAGKIGAFVGDLLGLAELKAPSAGGFIGFIKDIAAAIADAVDSIDELLQKGASLSQAFGSVSIDLPSMPSMPDLPELPSLGSIMPSGDDGKLAAMSGGVKSLTGDVKDLTAASKESTEKGLFSGDDVMSVLSSIGDFLGNLKDGVADFFSGFSAEDLVSAFNTAIFATIGYEVIRFIHTLRKNFGAFMGIGEAFNQVIGNVGDALKSFQTQARAQLILNIGIAIGILAASLWLLSKIPADKLATGLTAMGAMFIMLNLTMKRFAETMKVLEGGKMAINMVAFSIAVTALAAAMLLLAVAMLIMNKVKWDSIAKGLITMVVLMKTLEQLGKLGEHAAKNLFAGAAAIAVTAASMILLAGALLLFKLVDWKSMAKAAATLAGVALAVGLLALTPPGVIEKVGLAMLAVSVGMLALANALVIFAAVKWESIGKAAVVLGLLTLALIALAVVGGPVTASGFIAMSAAMIGFAAALMILNNVEWASIGKIALLMGVLLIALLGLTGVLYLLAPVIPVLALFAAAMFALGLALLAFSAALAIAMGLAAGGVAAFAALATGAAVAIAVFMQTLAKEAPIMRQAFLDILQELINTIVQAVPMVIRGIKDLWNAVKKELTSGDKKKATGEAGKSWIERLEAGIRSMMPKIINAGINLLVVFLRGVASRASELSSAGVGIVVGIINGISKRISDITDAAVDLIVRFANGIANGAVRILNAGIQMIATFLHGLADAIRGGSDAIGSGIQDVVDAMQEVGSDMVGGLISGIGSRTGDAVGAVAGLAGSMIGKAKGIFKILSPSRVFRDIGKFLVSGLTLGVQANAASAISAVASMTKGTIAMSESLVNGYINRLDQRALAARAKAKGLADAARTAEKMANKTKGKEDDKAAKKLGRDAKKADKEADAAEKAEKAELARRAKQRKWDNASAAERAKIKADEAKRQIEAAKASEREAEANRVEAAALERQAKTKGLNKKQRERLRDEAERLRKEAREAAERANAQLTAASSSAASALEWQKKAGAQAAKAFQDQFDAERKADEDQEAFEKLSDAEKAKRKREEAAALQKQADDNLEKAKKLAYSDLERANATAEIALDQAERARALVDEAEQFEAQGGGGGQVLNLDPSLAAATAFDMYADLYDSAMAAAAAAPSVEFTQINKSPEALDPTTIYRQTNNLFTFAADKLNPSAA